MVLGSNVLSYGPLFVKNMAWFDGAKDSESAP
jgi:hypothetical protein